MNKKLRKSIYRFVSVLALCSLLAVSIPFNAAHAGTDITEIYTVDDLIELSRKCTLDSWSKNRVIELRANIDVSGTSFITIPTFGGTFNGNGYSISGVNHTEPVSPYGLFTVVQSEGVINNLKVYGNITFSESCNQIGGIAGINFGTINNCKYNGTISANEQVGGIAGINEFTGTILSCQSTGYVNGKSMTGGIAGYNKGAIKDCVNFAGININAINPTVNISDLDFDILTTISAVTSLDTYNVSVDSGGIAGFSDGYLMSCNNSGNVGYPHIGYNVGGIAGRSCGFIYNCKNTGVISGRRSVGGVAGFLEPYTVVNATVDKLAELNDELKKLNGLVDKAIDDSEGSSKTITRRLDSLNEYTDKAVDKSDEFTKSLSDYWDNNVSEVNRASLIVDEAISLFSNVTEQIPDMTQSVVDGLEKSKKAMDNIKSAVDLSKESLDSLSNAAAKLSSALEIARDGASDIARGVKNIDEAIQVKNYDYLDAGIRTVKNGTSDTISSLNAMSKASQEMVDVLRDSAWKDEFADEFLAISELVMKLSEQMEIINNAIDVIDDNIDIDGNLLEQGGDELSSGVDELSQAATAMSDGLALAEPGLNKIKEGFDDLAQATENNDDIAKANAIKKIAEGFGDLDVAMTPLKNAADLTSQGMSDISQGIKDIDDGIDIKDTAAIRAALDDIKAANDEIVVIVADLSVQLNEVAKTMKEMNEWLDRVGEAGDKVTTAFSSVTAGLSKVDNGFYIIDNNLDINLEDIKKSFADIKNGSDLVSVALAPAKEAMDDLTLASATFSGAVDYLSVATELIKDSINCFSDASVQLKNISKDFDKIAVFLDNAQPIQLISIPDDIDEQKYELKDIIKEIVAQLKTLNEESSDISDVLLGDVREINDQMNKVTDLAIEIVYDITGYNGKDINVDTSDENINGTTYGRTLECVNTGSIYGDINIGGVAGTMDIYDENDLESDSSVSISSIYHNKYERKTIIQASTNEGTVVAKRNNVGGICGEMKVGYITTCESYGSVRSESGNYVGGVVGLADSTIRNSYVKAFLSGNNYVGGIVGSSELDSLSQTSLLVVNCFSMVLLEGKYRYYGAIAGYDSGTFTNNIFVSDDLAGINMISYAGKAEPVAYADMIAMAGIPDRFLKFNLFFVADGEEVKKVSFDYDDSFDETVYPLIPVKEGCYSVWEEANLLNMHFDHTVNAIYTPFTTAISAHVREGSSVRAVYVEGLFDGDAEVRVEPSKHPFVQKNEADDILHIEFDPDGQDTHVIRYLPKASILKKVTLYRWNGEDWEKQDYEKIGSYLAFEVSGTECDIALVHTATKGGLIAAGVGSIAFIGFIILFNVIKRRIKKRRKEELEEGLRNETRLEKKKRVKREKKKIKRESKPNVKRHRKQEKERIKAEKKQAKIEAKRDKKRMKYRKRAEKQRNK